MTNMPSGGSKEENMAFCVARFHYLFPRNNISAVFEYDEQHYLFGDLPKMDFPGEQIFGSRLLKVDKDGLTFEDCNPLTDDRCNKVMEKEVLYKEVRKREHL